MPIFSHDKYIFNFNDFKSDVSLREKAVTTIFQIRNIIEAYEIEEIRLFIVPTLNRNSLNLCGLYILGTIIYYNISLYKESL